MNALHSLLIVLVAAWTTIVTRAFPFALLRNRPLSPFLRYLGAILPSAIIVILLVYCLRASFGLPLMEALPSFLALGAVFSPASHPSQHAAEHRRSDRALHGAAAAVTASLRPLFKGE